MMDRMSASTGRPGPSHRSRGWAQATAGRPHQVAGLLQRPRTPRWAWALPWPSTPPWLLEAALSGGACRPASAGPHATERGPGWGAQLHCKGAGGQRCVSGCEVPHSRHGHKGSMACGDHTALQGTAKSEDQPCMYTTASIGQRTLSHGARCLCGLLPSTAAHHSSPFHTRHSPSALHSSTAPGSTGWGHSQQGMSTVQRGTWLQWRPG
jgi:hypothetical protein